MRAAVFVVTVAMLACCRPRAEGGTADAGGGGALTGEVSIPYANELDALCAFLPLGPMYEKPSSEPDADPIGYLRKESSLAEQPRTRSLIALVLAKPPAERSGFFRNAFLSEAKPLLLTNGRADPSAPTAPWGRDDTARDWSCRLADRLGAVGH